MKLVSNTNAGNFLWGIDTLGRVSILCWFFLNFQNIKLQNGIGTKVKYWYFEKGTDTFVTSIDTIYFYSIFLNIEAQNGINT